MKKLKYLLLIIPFLFIPNVYAEVPTGELYSEFATHKVKLLDFMTAATEVSLYGYDNPGTNPSLSSFMTGTTSLVRYEDNTNDTYSNWAIRMYRSYHGSGTYSMSWRVTFTNSSNAGSFCQRIGTPSVTGGTVNSFTCSVNSNTSYLLINYTLNNADTGTSKFDFTFSNGGMSINWFLRLATAVYYPQISVSDKFDTSGLENQNQIIINQNQTTISQNNTIIDQNNQQIQEQKKTNETLTDDNTQQAQDSAGGFFNDFTTDTHGLTAIITAPLSLISKITSASCSPLVIPLPYVDKDLTLPCMGAIYSNYFGSFLSIYQIITFGIVAYWVLVRIFNLVKDFKNPDHDEIEVLDL